MEITSIKLALIDEDKDQPRYQFNQEALEELANSIKEIGLLSPIKVRDTGDGRYKIIYGNRRYKASLMVGLETIPCIVTNISDEMEIYYEQIAENLTREDFSPIEEAEAFNKLLNDDKFRISIKLLSSKLGKTESYIKNKLELLKFSNAVKKLIVGGTQIRKDCLTEEQLMPLKDIAIEYRDSLALTAARDELPVSDVKKIAKLFKDSSISDSTKQKLLLKSGSGLIETWSTYEQNRKEKLAREKQQKENAAKAKEVAEAENTKPLPSIIPSSSLSEAEQDRISNHDDHIAAPFTEQVELVSSGFNINRATYIDTIDQLEQLTAQLQEQLKLGAVDNLDAAEQLASDVVIKLHNLHEAWRLIMKKSQA